MKQILLLLLTFSGYSQNIALDDLLNLRKMDLAGVEEFLTAKNWKFISGVEEDYVSMGVATFAYNKSLYDDKAESFLSFFHTSSNEEDSNRIIIQISSQDKYNNYLSRIKAFGCKLLQSNIIDGDVKKVYQGKTTTFVITVSTLQDEFNATSTLYKILVLDNLDYFFEYGRN